MYFSRQNHDSAAFASTSISGSLSFSSREGKQGGQTGRAWDRGCVRLLSSAWNSLAMDVDNLPFWMQLQFIWGIYLFHTCTNVYDVLFTKSQVGGEVTYHNLWRRRRHLSQTTRHQNYHRTKNGNPRLPRPSWIEKKCKHHNLSYALKNSTNQEARKCLLRDLLFSEKIIEGASIIKPAGDSNSGRVREGGVKKIAKTFRFCFARCTASLALRPRPGKKTAVNELNIECYWTGVNSFLFK